jgi:hypothetical protein
MRVYKQYLSKEKAFQFVLKNFQMNNDPLILLNRIIVREKELIKNK